MIWQLNDPGLDNYDYFQDAKIHMLNIDSWLLEDRMLEDTFMVLLDLKDVSFKYLTKLRLSVVKTLCAMQVKYFNNIFSHFNINK